MKQSALYKTVVSLLLVLIALPLCISCNDDADPTPPNGQASPRVDFDSIHPLVLSYSNMLETWSDTTSVLDYRYIRGADAWRGLDIRLGSDVPYYPYSDTMSHKELFRYLMNINNDTCYKEGVEYFREMYHNSHLQRVYIEDIVDLQVTAVTDFDKDHPAGSDLSDLCYLSYGSSYKYVQEGCVFNERSIGNGIYPALREYYETGPVDTIWWRKGRWDGVLNKHCWERGVREILNHIKVADIKNNRLKMVSGLEPTLSFSVKPAQRCKIEITRTIQIPGGIFPARVSKGVRIIE